MRVHNRVWLIVILLGWAALVGCAASTDGFQHQPRWIDWTVVRR